MKNIVLYLYIYIQLSVSYKIPTPELPMKNCLRVTIDGQHHTILVDNSNSTDALLKECIVKNIHFNQSILLLNGLKTHKQIDPITSNQPNVIIMTNSLNHQVFDIFNFSLNNVIAFHWNLLYIVVTEYDGIYKCNDGKFDENTMNVIQNFMNDLWHRFEMTRVVLIFPYSCHNTYVIYGDNIQTNMRLLNRTVKLIRPKTFNELSSAILKSSSDVSRGYTINIGIFPRFPTSLKQCKDIHTYVNFDGNLTNGFCGLDGLIMQDAVKYFKFNIFFTTDSRCNKYGFVDYSKISFGSLGCVINRTVDISFNSRFMVMYRNESFHFLQYVIHDFLCALLPVPKIYELWHYPYMPLESIHWLTVIIIIAIASAVAWISDKIMYKLTGERPISLKTCVLNFATSTMCGFSLKKSRKYYFLRGLCLGFSIIILSYYQGYINYSFTTLKRYESIKTLQQLFDLKYVLYTSTAVRDLLKQQQNNNNPQEVNFISRAILQPNTEIGIVLNQPKSVTLGRFTDVNSEILLRYRDGQGKPMIYVVDECFRHYYLSYISKFDFLFTKKFKLFMEHLLQAGIPDKYYKWTRRTLGLPDPKIKHGSEARPITKINMQDQSIAFGILLSGYVLSTTVFILEKWWAKRIISAVDRT